MEKDKIQMPVEGWSQWADLLLNVVTNLDKDIKEIREELNETTKNLYFELHANKNDINNIKISLEELKRIGDKLEMLNALVSDMKPLLSEVAVLKNVSETLKEAIKANKELNTKISDLDKQIAVLKSENKKMSMIFGAIAGAIPPTIAFLVSIFTKK